MKEIGTTRKRILATKSSASLKVVSTSQLDKYRDFADKMIHL